jgi:hypothetical protein
MDGTNRRIYICIFDNFFENRRRKKSTFSRENAEALMANAEKLSKEPSIEFVSILAASQNTKAKNL